MFKRSQMELSIQEVNLYTELISKGKAVPIFCPLSENKEFPDIMMSMIDKNNKVYFKFLSCKANIYPGLNTIEKIRAYIAFNSS